jgi:hypothetical protein
MLLGAVQIDVREVLSMKRVVRFLLAMFVAGAMSLPAIGQQQSVPKSNFQGQGHREVHPHIRAAIRELQEAKKELQSAAHDFGGHREDAVKACDEAINQLRQALQYDKK